MRARQLACIQASNLHLILKGSCVSLADLKLRHFRRRHTIKSTPTCRSILWAKIQTPLSKHTWDVHIIAIWNIKCRHCLNACNKNWLKELAKGIPEAKWKIKCITDVPYPFALSTEKTTARTYKSKEAT